MTETEVVTADHLTCRWCGKDLPLEGRRGRKPGPGVKYGCCTECRHGRCSGCGTDMLVNAKSRPPETRLCDDCRGGQGRKPGTERWYADWDEHLEERERAAAAKIAAEQAVVEAEAEAAAKAARLDSCWTFDCPVCSAQVRTACDPDIDLGTVQVVNETFFHLERLWTAVDKKKLTRDELAILLGES